MSEPFAFFDAHCHLAPDSGSGELAGSGVAAGRMLCGVEPGEWDRLAGIAAAWPGTVAAYGIHPWYAIEARGDWRERLRQRLEGDAFAWLGEAGLDGLRVDRASPEAQESVFASQLRLARRLGRRVNLHCVKAWDKLLALLDREYLGPDGRAAFIVHSFAGPHQAIAGLVRRGAYFTVGPLFSRRDSRRHRARVALLPADRLLLESDAFVQPFRDAADDVEHALNWLASVRQTPPDALAGLLLDNSRRMLNYG